MPTIDSQGATQTRLVLDRVHDQVKGPLSSYLGKGLDGLLPRERRSKVHDGVGVPDDPQGAAYPGDPSLGARRRLVGGLANRCRPTRPRGRRSGRERPSWLQQGDLDHPSSWTPSCVDRGLYPAAHLFRKALPFRAPGALRDLVRKTVLRLDSQYDFSCQCSSGKDPSHGTMPSFW